MKKIEDRITSLELSRRAKEAGLKQEGVWWWVDGGINNVPLITHKAIQEGVYPGNIIIAPTVAEWMARCYHLGLDGGGYAELYINKYGEKFRVTYQVSNVIKIYFYDKSLANACCKMWLRLKEKGITNKKRKYPLMISKSERKKCMRFAKKEGISVNEKKLTFNIVKDTGDGKGAERYFVFRILPGECLLTGYLGMWRKKPTRKQMIEAAGKKKNNFTWQSNERRKKQCLNPKKLQHLNK